MSFEDPESGRGTGMGVVSTARTARPVAHWMQAGQLRSPLLAILFLQSPMQPEKVAGRQLQTTCLEIGMRTSNAKLEHLRERSWSLILPQLRLFQRTIPGTFSSSFGKTILGAFLISLPRSISGMLSRTRVCILGIVLRFVNRAGIQEIRKRSS